MKTQYYTIGNRLNYKRQGKKVWCWSFTLSKWHPLSSRTSGLVIKALKDVKIRLTTLSALNLPKTP